MAFLGSSQLGFAASKTANQASATVTNTVTSVEAGALVMLLVAVDNASASAVPLDEGAVSSVTDSVGGNTWTKAREWCNARGAAQAGATVSMWYTVLASILPLNATITANFTSATSRDASVIAARKVSLPSGSTVAVENTVTEALSASTPGLLDVATSNIECLRIRATAAEAPGNPIASPGTAGWTVFIGGGATTYTIGGSSITNIGFGAEFHVSTGTSDQSNPGNPGFTADLASVYVALREVPGNTSGDVAVDDAPDIMDVVAEVTTGAAAGTTDDQDLTAITAANWTTAGIATIDGADTMGATGSIGGTTSAGVSVTDGADSPAAAGANWTTAQASSTDGPDVQAQAARVTTGGAVSSADGPDVTNASAANWATAQVAANDGADAGAAAAQVTTGGAIVSTDAQDAPALVAANWTNAALASTDAQDAPAATGNAGGLTSSGIASTDAPDATAVVDRVTTGAAIATTDGADSPAIAAARWMTALVAAMDAPDAMGVGTLIVPVTLAGIAAQDAPDLMALGADSWTTADLALTDAPDLSQAGAESRVAAFIATIDGADVMSISQLRQYLAVAVRERWTQAGLKRAALDPLVKARRHVEPARARDVLLTE